MVAARRVLYRRFKPAVAPFWGVSASTYYRVVGFSISGWSVYLEMNGQTRMVPRDALTFTDV